MKKFLVVAVVMAMGGCTLVRYTDGDKTLTVADVRVSGSAIDLDAVLKDKGSVSVNREQGSTAEVVEAVGEAVSPL